MARHYGALFLAAVLCLLSGSNRGTVTSPPTGSPALSRTRPARPLVFEANAGQLDPQARFVARTPGYSLFFTDAAVILAGGNDVVRLQFEHSRPGARPEPREPLAATSNYLIGDDPAQWKTGVPNYGRVHYADLYPGIDLVFYGNERELEYDLVVSPGIDPSMVRMTLDGTRELAVADNGDLVGRADHGEIRFRRPVIYQATHEGPSTPIDGRYRLEDGNTVSFDIAGYDPAQPLVIDPVVVYSTYLGGSEADATAGSSGGGARQMIAVDSSGAAYVAGTTNSLNFPTTSGSWQPSSPIATGFITKIAPDGESLVYSTFIGGTTASEDCGGSHFCAGVAGGIAVDAGGNAYVVGNATSNDFPASVSPFAPYRDHNMFLLKLNPSGSSLVYSILFGVGLLDVATGVAVDTTGNAYVTGASNGSLSATNIVTASSLQSSCYCPSGFGGTIDAFVIKFNPTATSVVYGTYLGGWGGESGSGIAVNSAGEAYVTGRTNSDDFPVANAAQPIRAGGNADDFVVKLNTSGSAFVFSTFLGGSDFETKNALGSAIAVDPAGNAYVTGYTESGNFPRTPGAFQVDPGPGPSTRAYATKYSPSGQVIYSTFLAGNGGSFGTSVAADAMGRGYFGGSTGSTNFPLTPDATQASLASGASGADAYVAVLDPTGSALVFSTYLGGPSSFDYATGIALGPGGSIYVAGITEGTGGFPTTATALQPSYGGNTDVFVTRIDIQPPDTTPPVIDAVTVTPGVLWPPDHTMRPVSVTASAHDDRSATVACAITQISSNEPANGLGDGDQAPDWQNTSGLTTMLRAERDGRRTGRVYTVTITCSDEAGNTSTRAIGVAVPHRAVSPYYVGLPPT